MNFMNLLEVCCGFQDRSMASTHSSDKLDERISLLELLSTCADACARGCEVIRFVHQKRTKKIGLPASKRNKDGVESKIDVKYKIADDPRSALTEADESSQDIIIQCLRSVWGVDLNIVGEEEDGGKNVGVNTESRNSENLFDKYKICKPSKRMVSSNLLSEVVINDGQVYVDDRECMRAEDSNTAVALSDVTLYVDPMDGTREFVEGRIWNVQCLIGITYRGKPVAGVIGIPFFGSSAVKGDMVNQVGIAVICALNWEKCAFVEQLNMPNNGVLVLNKGEASWRNLSKSSSGDVETAEKLQSKKKVTLQVYMGDSKSIHIQHCIDLLKAWTVGSEVALDFQVMGGCGAKILRTAARGLEDANGNAMCILRPGTSSWDTAAPTNILFSCLQKFGLKGKCTDLFGGEFVYDSSGTNVTNDLGGLISCGSTAVEYHKKLCQAMRTDKAILNSVLSKYWNATDSESYTGNTALNGRTKSSRGKKTRLEEARQESQAVDIARSDEGYIMTCEEVQHQLANQLGQEHKIYLNLSPESRFELVGYAVPESEAVRGKSGTHQSNFHLHWKMTHPSKRLRTIDGESCSLYAPPDVVTCKRKAIDDSKFSVEFSLQR